MQALGALKSCNNALRIALEELPAAALQSPPQDYPLLQSFLTDLRPKLTKKQKKAERRAREALRPKLTKKQKKAQRRAREVLQNASGKKRKRESFCL